MDDFDVLGAEFFADPYPVMAEMRRNAPCYYDSRLEAFIVTRFRDVEHALGGEEFSAERVDQWGKGAPEHVASELAFFTQELKRWPPFNNAPVHTRLRNRLAAVFGPQTLPRIRAIAPQIIAGGLDEIAAAASPDLIRDFAFPVPARILADLLGIPRADIEAFKRWTGEVFTLIGAGIATEQAVLTGHRGITEMRQYVLDLLRERRLHPRDDLVSALAQPAAEDDGVSEADVAGLIMVMIAAGHETTTFLIGNALNALFADPGARQEAGGNGITEDQVDEFARYDGAVFSVIRLARDDMTIAGTHVGQGQPVFCMLNSANRDPRVNREPDRLMLSRQKITHVGFGTGIHKCIGAMMARMVVGEAVTQFLRRFPQAAHGGEPEWIRNLGVRGLQSFPLSLQGG
jgi:cytochrome P450